MGKKNITVINLNNNSFETCKVEKLIIDYRIWRDTIYHVQIVIFNP